MLEFMHLVENTVQLAEARRLWACTFGVHCAQEQLCTRPPQSDQDLFLCLHPSVLLLFWFWSKVGLWLKVVPRVQREAKWKSSWLPSARKGPLEALSDWMGQGSHDHPWEGCPPAPELGLWLLPVAWGSPTHTWTQWGRDVCWYSVALSCLTFCEPVNGSLLGSSVHGIFQAKILE